MARDERADRLRRAIDGLRAEGHTAPIDLAPRSTHEAITRRMVEDLAADVSEIKGRVNGLLWLVAGAVVLELAMRVGGWR